MSELMLSKGGLSTFRNFELQACPECSCEQFRELKDVLQENFRVYRATAARDLWRTVKEVGIDLGPVMSDLVCVACEQAQEQQTSVASKRMLVVYDYQTGKQKEIEFPRSAGGWR